MLGQIAVQNYKTRRRPPNIKFNHQLSRATQSISEPFKLNRPRVHDVTQMSNFFFCDDKCPEESSMPRLRIPALPAQGGCHISQSMTSLRSQGTYNTLRSAQHSTLKREHRTRTHHHRTDRSALHRCRQAVRKHGVHPPQSPQSRRSHK